MLLLHGSVGLVFVWLIVGSLGVPLPEDVALLGTGVLIHQGAHPVIAPVVAFAGVLGGDALLFFLARRLGPAALERKMFQKILPPERRAKIERAYDRYGGRLVFFARHVGGLRAATFAMAGIHGMKPWRFLAWDAAGAIISVPLMIGLGYFGSLHVERMRKGIAHTEHYVMLAVAIGLLVWITVRHVRKLRGAPARA